MMQLYTWLMGVVHSNPMFAGAFAIWLGGMSTFLLRNVPAKLGGWLVTHTTSSLTLIRESRGWNSDNYEYFMKWVREQPLVNMSRNYMLSSQRITTAENPAAHFALIPGYGKHWFLFRGRLFWFGKVKLDSQGVSEQKEQISIRGLTRSRVLITQLKEQFAPQFDPASPRREIYRNDGRGWSLIGVVPAIGLRSIIIAPELESELVTQIKNFNESREWYVSRGLNYKLALLFYGPPGTGKTSTSAALASTFSRDLRIVSLDDHDDSSLLLLMSTMGKTDIVLIEDCTSATVLLSDSYKPKNSDNVLSIAGMDRGSLTLSGVLNALDGVAHLDGPIIIFSTNYIERLAEEFIRDGRIDGRYHFDIFTNAEVHRYVRAMYPDYTVPIPHTFENIAGSSATKLFLKHKYDAAAFVAELPKVQPCTTKPGDMSFTYHEVGALAPGITRPVHLDQAADTRS